MQNELNQLKAKLATAKSLLILLPQNTSTDTMAAALALFLSFTDAGRAPDLVSVAEPLVRDSHLVGLDRVKNTLSGQNLVLTVDVAGDVVDKVTSTVVDGKLSLTVIPKSGFAPLKPSDIRFGSSGSTADLIFALGADSLAAFGSLPTAEAALFSQATIVNLSSLPSAYGSINLVDPSSSLCELVTAVIQELGLPLSQDAANNLMLGIESATDNLQSTSLTADTFEALAILYRAGARRQPKSTLPQATIINNTPIIDTQVIAEREREDQLDIDAIKTELHDMSTPSTTPPDVQPEWLKPKIFKSSNDK